MPLFLVVFLLTVNAAIAFDREVHGEGRTNRFITFNNDQSSIRLEMVFAIPFLHIPIGHSSGTGLLPPIDINLKSLAATGIVLFILYFVLPILIKVTLPNSSITRGWETSETSKLLERMERSLSQYGIDSNVCLKEGLCHVMQSARGNVKTGLASSWDKIIDGISSNDWVYPMLTDYVMPTNCSSTYNCPIINYNFADLLNNMKLNMRKLNFGDFKL